ncbi:MAG TPA: hypothetical protein VGC84_19300, partial [Ilumatobacteraceae bacterium]
MIHRWKPRSLRHATAAAAIVLAVGGVAVIGVAQHSQHTAPQPSRAASGSITGPISPTTTAAKPTSNAPTTTARKVAPTVTGLPASPPTALDIASIGVRTPLIRLGRNPDGSVQVPESFHVAGWYSGSVTPGQTGPTVIVGH